MVHIGSYEYCAFDIGVNVGTGLKRLPKGLTEKHKLILGQAFANNLFPSKNFIQELVKQTDLSSNKIRKYFIAKRSQVKARGYKSTSCTGGCTYMLYIPCCTNDK